MKRTYKEPSVRFIDYKYDEQVTATSNPTSYCDQGWTKNTVLLPPYMGGSCSKCDDTLIWIESTAPSIP